MYLRTRTDYFAPLTACGSLCSPHPQPCLRSRTLAVECVCSGHKRQKTRFKVCRFQSCVFCLTYCPFTRPPAPNQGILEGFCHVHLHPRPRRPRWKETSSVWMRIDLLTHNPSPFNFCSWGRSQDLARENDTMVSSLPPKNKPIILVSRHVVLRGWMN